MLKKLRSIVGKSRYWQDRFPNLAANVLEVRSFECLRKAMNWPKSPLLEGDYLHAFDYLEDLNDRRLHDAEVIGAASCNGAPKILLEIGTSLGRSTALMAKNAPDGVVFTVNIPPEEIADGGKNVTFAPSRENIGQYYRAQGCTNVKQIFANTKTWAPDFGPIDVAFIDGCHDAAFVYDDTRKVLSRCRSGSVLLWHDFNPSLALIYPWIADVCSGVERLYADGMLSGRVLHLQDSWIGLYKTDDYDVL
jgi:hypothetical protein